MATSNPSAKIPIDAISNLRKELEAKVSIVAFRAALKNKVSSVQMNNALALAVPPDLSAVESELDALTTTVAGKADATDVDSALAVKATTTALASLDDEVSEIQGQLGALGVGNKTFYNVMNYGAVGDGVTDDTRAIQAAIDAASVELPGWEDRLPGTLNSSTNQDVNGSTVYLPTGKYKTSAPLKMYGGVFMYGDGEPSSVLLATFAARAVTITSVGTTATVTTTGNHGYQVDDRVTIAGASQAEYNGSFLVAVVISDTQFTYTMTGDPTSPATGSPTVQIYNATTRAVIEGRPGTENLSWNSFEIGSMYLWCDLGHGIRLYQGVKNDYTAAHVLLYNGSTWTDYSEDNAYIFDNNTTLTALATTAEELYIGHPTTFTQLAFILQQVLKKTLNMTTTAYRQSLSIQYWNGSTWATLTLTQDLSYALSAGYACRWYFTAPGNWATTTVNGVASQYWLKVTISSGTPSIQPAIINNILTGLKTISGRFRNLAFKVNGWGMFFPDAYAQNCQIDETTSIKLNGGLLFLEGNGNHVCRANTEGGPYDTATFAPPYGMLTVWGHQNTITDCIIEGVYVASSGYAPAAYWIRGPGCLYSGNYQEGSFVPFDNDQVVFEQSGDSVINSAVGPIKFVDCPNVVLQTADTAGSDLFRSRHKMIGTSTLYIQHAHGDRDGGMTEDPRIQVGAFYMNTANRLVTGSTNPTTGNLLFNGDFNRGTAGWKITPTSPLQASTSVVKKTDSLGNCLKVILTAGDINGRECNINTNYKVPTAFSGSPGYHGYRLDIQGNASYTQISAAGGASSITNGKAVIPITAFDAGKNLIRFRVSMGLDYSPVLYTANGNTYTNVTNALFPAFAAFNASTDYLYLSNASTNTDLTSLLFDLDRAGAGCTLVIEYYDGSWKTVTGVSDGTISGGTSFGQSGTITFSTGTSPTDVAIDGLTRRWIRISLSGGTGTSPLVNFIKTGSTALHIRTYNGVSYITRTSRATTTDVANAVTVFSTTSDYVYVYSANPVNAFDVRVVSAGSGITLAVEYWDGGVWAAGVVTDGTSALTTVGTNEISFTTPTPRYQTYINKTLGYWTRFRVSAVTSAPKLGYIGLPLKATVYLSDVYAVAGMRHNTPPDSGAALRFTGGNTVAYANEVLKETAGTWAEYITTLQAPNDGTWVAGDQVLFNAPAAGGYLGWVCTAAGTPGTWKRFGAIEA